MKRIYLVKKDPEKPGSEENWIVMTTAEYRAFLDTGKGKKRKNDFGRLDGYGAGDTVIIAECGRDKAAEWQNDMNRERYRRKRDRGPSELDPLFCASPMPREGSPSGLPDVPDTDADTEGTVVEKIMKEELREAVRSLPRAERELILALYLGEKPLSEKEYAGRIGARRSQVCSMKAKALEKLRDTLSEKGKRTPRRLS